MKQGLKDRAIKLRKLGNSYNLIAKELGVSKSTLSSWLKNEPFEPNALVLKRISESIALSSKIKNKQKLENIKQASKDAANGLGKITKRDLLMLGIGLYMGEGSKMYEIIRVINSDPKIIKLSIKWLTDSCGLTTDNFTLAIHIYPDLDKNATLKYWSKQTGIPLNQFGKTQIDLRSDKKSKKKHKLPYGTAHLSVKSNGRKEFGVYLHRKIIGYINHINNSLRV